jgi:pantothenate kinase
MFSTALCYRITVLSASADLVGTALDHIARVAARPEARVLVGIAGPPGAGKSTLAAAIGAALLDAVVVPMDGFHLANAELERLGLADRKGAPETFDASGFVCLLQRIARRDAVVYAPAYSRVLHESIGGAIAIPTTARVIVVEGNYLLIPTEPWARVRELLDLAIYLEVADEIRVSGLIRRQVDMGRDETTARAWVMRSDEANARLIAPTRAHADLVLARVDPARN